MHVSERPKASYDVARLTADMALRGWNGSDLAREANISHMTVSRFMRGEAQTAKTAKKLALALGYSVRRYLMTQQAVSA